MGDNRLYEVRGAAHGVGKGLFAARPIACGTYIIEYTGVHIPTHHADTLNDNRYLVEIDDNWTIDGSSETNIARYINHSCDPNCEGALENGHVCVVARRVIAANEELTLDYGNEHFEKFIRPGGCKCAWCVAKASQRVSARKSRVRTR